MKRSRLASDSYGVEDTDALLEEAISLRTSLNAPSTTTAEPLPGPSNLKPNPPAPLATVTKCTCGALTTKTGTDPRADEDTMEKLVTALEGSTVEELRDAAKAIGVKKYQSGDKNGKKQRLAITLASSPHKMLILLLSHFKISKSSLPSAYVVPPQPCYNAHSDAPYDDPSVPHPRWSAIFKEYPSGKRTMYINPEGEIARSVPHTHRIDARSNLISDIPLELGKSLALSANANIYPNSADANHTDNHDIRQGLPQLYRILPDTTPNLRRMLVTMRIRSDNSIIRSRKDALTMAHDEFGSWTEQVRKAASISLMANANSSDQPCIQLPDLDIPSEIATDDAGVRMDQWKKLAAILPKECWANMCGGLAMYAATPPEEASKAIARKALLAAGSRGSSFARDRSALHKYHEYRRIHNIHTPPFPIPAAIAANTAHYYMRTSDAYANGAGTSIGPGIMAAFNHMQLHLGLPVDLTAPVSRSIPKHAASGHGKAEPVPLWLWQNIERLCNEAFSPLTYYMRNLWICIATSTRAIEFHRVRPYDEYDLPHAACTIEISVAKSGQQHVVISLSDEGLLGKITWLQAHMQLVRSMGFSTPRVNGPISTATAFLSSRMPASSWSTLVLELYAIAGMPKATQKKRKLTAHSPHATAASIASVLQWNDTARSDLGRWAHSGGQSHMPFRYATRASALNQMYIRATIIQSIKELAPPSIPETFDIEHMRASPFYDTSLFVGPFVHFNIDTADGHVFDVSE